MSIRFEDNGLTLRLFCDEKSAMACSGVVATRRYQAGWIGINIGGRWVDDAGVLPPTWQPEPSAINVIEPWKQQVASALANVQGLQITFATVLQSNHPSNSVYLSHTGQACRVASAVVDPGVEYDEESLPYYRVRFDDGVELDAGNEELFSTDPRFFELASAVCGGFAESRELDFVGPFHLQDEGSDDVKELFLERLGKFKITECEQHFNTPVAFRVKSSLDSASSEDLHVTHWGMPIAKVTPVMPKVVAPKQKQNQGMDAKGLARAMRVQLGTLGFEVTHAQALELMARTAGLADWNTLAAKAGRSNPVAASVLEQEPSLVPETKTGFFCPKCGKQGTVRRVASAFVEQGPYEGNSYMFEGDADHWCCDACGHQFLDWQSDWSAAVGELGYLLVLSSAPKLSLAQLIPVRSVLAALAGYGDRHPCPQYASATTGKELAAVINREVANGGDNSDLIATLCDYANTDYADTVHDSAHGKTASDALKALLAKLPPGIIDLIENLDICA